MLTFPYQFQNPFQQMMTTPPVVQQPTSIPQAPMSTNIVGVNGVDGMKALQTGPNSKVVGFDLNEDIFYIKITDAANTAVIETYDFSKRADKEEKDDEKFVTVKEFNKFKEDLLNGKQYIRKPKHNAGSNSKSYKPNNRTYEYTEEPSVVDVESVTISSELSSGEGTNS